MTFNKAMIDECVSWGPRIDDYRIEFWADGEWKTAFAGKGAGANATASFDAVTADKVRLHILNCLPGVTGGPSVWDFGLYMDGALAELQVDGVPVPGFDPGVFSYTVGRTLGSTPVITAKLAYLANGCEVVPAEVPGTATVTVTTLEGQKVVYTIHLVEGDAPAPVVREVKIQAVSGVMGAGKNLRLQAAVEGVGAVSQAVRWKVEGDATARISTDGLLTAGPDFKGALTVTAVSAANPAVSGRITIEVRPVGDLNKDGSVNISDVMEACKVLARKSSHIEPTPEEVQLGDLTGDGKVSITDVMAICKVLAGKA